MITPVDNVNPFVIGLTPANNSDVSPSNLQVVYTFSEPIKQRAYTRTDLPPGSNTITDDIKVMYVGLKKAATAITFLAQWNAGFSQLTITPQGIVGSARYTVDLTAAFNSGNLTDNANLVVVNNPNITGDFEVMQFSTNGSSPVPAAPSLTRRLLAGIYPASISPGVPSASSGIMTPMPVAIISTGALTADHSNSVRQILKEFSLATTPVR